MTFDTPSFPLRSNPAVLTDHLAPCGSLVLCLRVSTSKFSRCQSACMDSKCPGMMWQCPVSMCASLSKACSGPQWEETTEDQDGCDRMLEPLTFH